ncbi:CbiQ family ECF transporter T component [Nocardioides sp.]|uniref:CbiQ family ECF transporter T component n=1 Tax=Nocardioides sp. TaxID=35761 RepID=UPI0035272DF4
MTGTTPRRLPRDLHPAAWWGWALGLAAAASLTTNPLVLLGLAAAAWLVVVSRRSARAWAGSFRLYAGLALMIVLVRVAFRIVFGVDTGHVVLDLPEVPLPDWVAGIRLFGPVTRESLLAGLYDGLRLGAIVVCVGAANSLANPKRLLASVPAALYEVGTALVVSVTIFPQLADSVRRVRAAQALRGGPAGRVARTRRFLVPVLEDALERSLALAAGMDTRGYGRAGEAARRERARSATLLLAALVGLGVGSYAVLDTTAPRLLATPMLVLGVLLAVAGLRAAGRRVSRTRYRPDRWLAAETAATACGLATAALVWWAGRTDLSAVHPGVEAWPTVTLPLLVAVAAASLPAWVTPPPVDPWQVAVVRTDVPLEVAA